MRLVFLVLFLLLLSCGNKKNKLKKPAGIEKKIVKIRADSINEAFLSRAVYDTALFYNNSPLYKEEYLLNEKGLAFAYEGLGKSFTAEEKLMSIPIKELTWKVNEFDFISVCYVERNNQFVPVDVIVYNLNTKW